MASGCNGFNNVNGDCNKFGVFVPNYGLTPAVATNRANSKIAIYDTTLEVYSNGQYSINLDLLPTQMAQNYAELVFDLDSSSVTLKRAIPSSLGAGKKMEYLSYDELNLDNLTAYKQVRIAVNENFLWLTISDAFDDEHWYMADSATFFTGIPHGTFLGLLESAETNSDIRIADYSAFKNEISRDCAKRVRDRPCGTTSIVKLMSILN